MAWRIAECPWRARDRLDAFLRDDWEPFAVTDDQGEVTVWLRRETSPEYAGVEPMRPRSEHEAATP
jgi:hypothetical protein